MQHSLIYYLTLTLFLSFINLPSKRADGRKIKITGNVIEKIPRIPLEYGSYL
jgi:hypothetical protein